MEYYSVVYWHLCYWSSDWSTDWLTDWLTAGQIDWQRYWLADELTHPSLTHWQLPDITEWYEWFNDARSSLMCWHSRVCKILEHLTTFIKINHWPYPEFGQSNLQLYMIFVLWCALILFSHLCPNLHMVLLLYIIFIPLYCNFNSNLNGLRGWLFCFMFWGSQIKISGQYLKLGHDLFLPHPFEFVIHLSIDTL